MFLINTMQYRCPKKPISKMLDRQLPTCRPSSIDYSMCQTIDEKRCLHLPLYGGSRNNTRFVRWLHRLIRLDCFAHNNSCPEMLCTVDFCIKSGTLDASSASLFSEYRKKWQSLTMTRQRWFYMHCRDVWVRMSHAIRPHVVYFIYISGFINILYRKYITLFGDNPSCLAINVKRCRFVNHDNPFILTTVFFLFCFHKTIKYFNTHSLTRHTKVIGAP